MKIKVERSGGLAGITVSNEINAKILPTPLITAVNKLLSIQKTPKLKRMTKPIGGADHFSYKVTIEDGLNHKVIEFTEYDISNELRALVNYVVNDK